MTAETLSPVKTSVFNDFTIAHRNVFHAPPECKFASFADFRADAHNQMNASREIVTPVASGLFTPSEKYPVAVSFEGFESHGLTNLGLKHMMREIGGVSLDALERMQPATRCKVLNELWDRETTRNFKLLVQDSKDGGAFLRCATSESYTRLWDAQIADEIDRLLIPTGWKPASPTFKWGGGQISEQEYEKLPKALVRREEHSFQFFLKDDHTDLGGGTGPGGSDTVRKGLCIWNGETGKRQFGWSTFLFRDVCENFLIWGGENGVMKQTVHRANVIDAFALFREEVQQLSGELTEFEFEKLTQSRKIEFAPNADDAVKKLRTYGLTEANAKAAVALTSNPAEGAGDLSVWSVVNGVTAFAKGVDDGDARFSLQATAGRMLDAEVVMA